MRAASAASPSSTTARSWRPRPAPSIEDLDSLQPDWSLLEWDKYIYVPLNTPRRRAEFRARLPVHVPLLFAVEVLAQVPRARPEEVRRRDRDPGPRLQGGFFILADEEPTIHRKKFVAFCEELIARKIKVHWGINTRVTDILRDRELLPLFRKAGLVHVSLGTEAAAQLKLDRFRKETTIEENKLAIRLLKEAGMVAEAQFIMGLENETPETIEETYELAQDWKPDMANWNMYTPWPFAELFEELGDRVEVRDYSKYNFVTPIIQPDAMTRETGAEGRAARTTRASTCARPSSSTRSSRTSSSAAT